MNLVEGKEKKKEKKKSCLTNKLFHGGKGDMSLRTKSVNVSTLCQLGARSGEADKEDKKVLLLHLLERLWGMEQD